MGSERSVTLSQPALASRLPSELPQTLFNSEVCPRRVAMLWFLGRLAAVNPPSPHHHIISRSS
jgi:hypothetical protein